MLTCLPADALVRVHLRRLAAGVRARLGPARIGLLRHVRQGRDGIELLRGGVRDVRYLQQALALWREVSDSSSSVGHGTWAAWDGGAVFLGHDGGLAVEAEAGPGGRFAPPEVLEGVARLSRAGGGRVLLGLGSGHAQVAGAAAAAAAGISPSDLLRGGEAGTAMRLAPAPSGLALVEAGAVRIWASGTGAPGAWVLEGLADA